MKNMNDVMRDFLYAERYSGVDAHTGTDAKNNGNSTTSYYPKPRQILSTDKSPAQSAHESDVLDPTYSKESMYAHSTHQILPSSSSPAKSKKDADYRGHADPGKRLLAKRRAAREAQKRRNRMIATGIVGGGALLGLFAIVG